MLVVTVLFSVHPGRESAFRPLILANAAASREEPGCRRFDVAFSPDGARCFLYELYDDHAAFEAHCRTPHFHAFSHASAGAVIGKQADTFVLAQDPEPGPRRAA